MSGVRIGLVAILCAISAETQGNAGETAFGWRGNGTGLWPDATPPLTWRRIAKGAMEGLCAQADRPVGIDAGDAPRVEKGLIRDWLVLGPFPVGDAVKDFDHDPLGGESSTEPSAGQKTADKTWQTATVPPDDPLVFGNVELPWLDLAKMLGFQLHQVGYAHTYLFSPRGGSARIVVDHGEGLKAWVNGEVLYREPQRHIALQFYSFMGKSELFNHYQPSARFDLQLKPGWNRLLLKLSTPGKEPFQDMRCALRIMDPPNVSYNSENIAWMTELPGRSTSTPIQVGDRLFVMAEPDELVCLDKRSGRILWRASNSVYDVLSPDERLAKPAYAQEIDPLVTQLKQESDPIERVKLRSKMWEALRRIDAEKFTLPLNGHFEGHFGIVGFTMPTPVSDGRQIFVWCNTGVAACYELDGKRRWIRRLKTESIQYGASPALADGMLAVFLGELYGLDAATGEVRWKQFRIRNCLAALQATKIGDQSVFVTQRSEVIRPSDGEILYRPRDSGSPADTGWAPPVILGNLVYSPKYGVSTIDAYDFSGTSGDKLAPSMTTISLPSEINRKPDGGWLDRWTAGSPVVWQGLVYQSDIYGSLFVADLKTGRMLYRQQLDLHGLMHYNAVPVAASTALVGQHLVVCDNQGTAVVLEPGPAFKQLAINRIETQLERFWPIPAQEILAYAPPLADGKRLYLRGERYLYCIGAE